MQRYIILINFTEKGMKRIKNLPERIKAARSAVEKAGGKFIDWNLTMGIYDSVAIIELPDDAKIAEIILGSGKKGFIQTTTLKAFSESEAEKIVKKLPKVIKSKFNNLSDHY